MLAYTSRMRDLGQSASISTVYQASALARPARDAMAALPEEQILGDLLADRAGAAQAAVTKPAAFAARSTIFRLWTRAFSDRVQVEAMMGSEVLVFRRHHRQRQAGRQFVQVAPVVGYPEPKSPAPPCLQHRAAMKALKAGRDGRHRDPGGCSQPRARRQGEQPAEPAAYAAAGAEWMGHLS